MFDNKDIHPSYGVLQFSRWSGGTHNLFGSSIQHKDTICMTVKHGEIARELNSDWIFGTGDIVTVEMSYSQFAEAISSMGQGSGVPVTIKAIEGQPKIPPCPFVDKRKLFEDEFAEKLAKSNEGINSLISDITELFTDKKTIGKADKELILKKLSAIQTNIGSNTAFTYSMFNEQMEKTVLEAKGEVEAFVQNKMNSIAMQALAENKDAFIGLQDTVKL